MEPRGSQTYVGCHGDGVMEGVMQRRALAAEAVGHRVAVEQHTGFVALAAVVEVVIGRIESEQ